uniref:Uncharacterized protein n=1 Tax=Tabanus bromius TaxID=304241 RepID=A0A0K8TRV8_TABBR
MRDNTPPHPSTNIDLDEEELIEADVIEINDPGNEEFSDEDEEPILLEEIDEEEERPDLRVPKRDDSDHTFILHTSPVFCCAIHPTEDIAATGGEDDIAYVWSMQTTEVIHKVENHKDTVIAVDFSHDGKYLATGDISGEVFVFAVNQDYRKIWEYSMGDMCWMKWHSGSHVLIAGSEAGEIYVWRIISNDCKILPGAGQKCEAGELTKDGKHIFAGYGDGTIRLWDIKNSITVFKCEPNNPISHSATVTTVSCDTEKSLFLSGSEDGAIVISTHSGAIGIINFPDDAIERVAICPESELNIAAAATISGKILILDLSKHSVRTTCNHIEDEEEKDGITSMRWIQKEVLLCGTMRGHLLLFNGRNGERIRDLDGHAAHIYDIAYDKNKNIILSTSEDETAKVFKLTE